MTQKLAQGMNHVKSYRKPNVGRKYKLLDGLQMENK